MFIEEVSPSASRLILTNLQLSDSGVYACVVDQESSLLNLTVLSKLLVYTYVKFTIYLSLLHLNSNSELIFEYYLKLTKKSFNETFF